MPTRNQMRPNSESWWDAIAGEWQAAGDRRPDHDAGATAPLAGSPVLEVGCGLGSWAEAFTRMRPGFEYIGLDISSEMLAACSNRVPGVRLMQRDVLDLDPEWDGYFHSAVAFQTLEHFEDPAPVVDRIRKLARQRLVFSVPRGLPGPASQKADGHVYGWADDAAVRQYFGRWGTVLILAGCHANHIVGVVDWRGGRE